MTNQTIVSIKNLNHFFGEGALRRQTLFDIELEVKPREFVILTGPSGSGKSTLLSLIGCLRSVQQGSLKLLNLELKGATDEQLVQMRRKFGYITQASNLLQFLTAQQNVQMSLELHPQLTRQQMQQKASAMLEAVGLGDKLDSYPERLSGGQRQRVAIACALVTQPKLVLADEPTAALDKVSGRNVMTLMHRLAKEQGSAVVMVTHDHRILDLADRIINVEDGKLGLAVSQEISIALPGFDEALLEQAAIKPTVLTYQSQEIVFREGDPANKFYILLEGEVEILKEIPNQPPKLLNRLRRGDYFGEIGLLQGGKRTATVQVAKESELKLMVIDQELFRLVMTKSGLTSADIARNMHQRIMNTYLNDVLPELGFERVKAAASQVKVMHYGANSNIVQSGQEAKNFYLVAKGQVEMIFGHQSSRIISAGEYFGEKELMKRQRYNYTVRVLPDSDTEVLVLEGEIFCDLVMQSNASEEQVATAMRDRLIATNYEKPEIKAHLDLKSILPGLDPALLEQVANKPTLVNYAAGDIIIRQGDPATKFYVVVDGTVEVWQEMPDLSSKFLRQIKPSEYFGAVGLIQGGKSTVTLRASQDADVKLMVIAEELFRLLLAKAPVNNTDIVNRLHERVLTSYLAAALPNLSANRIIEITTKVKPVTYSPRDAIVQQGDLATQFYLIAKGSVEFLTQDENGQEVIAQIRQEGEYFGETELFTGKNYNFTVRAAGNTEVEILVLDRQSFCNLVIESNTDPDRVASVLRHRLLRSVVRASPVPK